MNTSEDLRKHDLLPATPRKEKGGEFDAWVRSIAHQFHLPIRVGDQLLSPSERLKTLQPNAEKCLSLLRYLFFHNRRVLDGVLRQFHIDLSHDSVRESRILYLVELLEGPAKSEKESQLLLNLDKKSGLEKIAPALRSVPQDEGNDDHANSALSPSRSKHVNNQQLKAPTSLRQTTLSWQSAKRRSDQGKDAQQPDVSSGSKSKRSSDGPLPEPVKHIRREESKTYLDKSTTSETSFQTRTSAFSSRTVSFATDSMSRSFASTLATSVGTHDQNMDENELNSSGSIYGAFDASQVEQLMTSFDNGSGENITFVEKLKKVQTQDCLLDRADSGNEEASARCEVERVAQPVQNHRNKHNSKGRSTTLEPCIVRDLPHHGLFTDPLPSQMSSLPFHLRWECLRVAQALEMSLEQLATRHITDEERLYQVLDSGSEKARAMNRAPATIWSKTKDNEHPTHVTYKAKLCETPMKTSKPHLFALTLNPLEHGQTSRLQRAFGAHRFLYLDIPSISTLAKQCGTTLNQRLHEWLRREKEFLGYTWQPFHVRSIREKELTGTLRVILFAIHGHGLTHVTLGELLNWTVPTQPNLHQPFCKAFSRVELSLSATIPTVSFKPSQVEFVEDVKADGGEDTTYNDPAYKFPSTYNPFKRQVMTDGCSLISVGAAKIICEKLNMTGMRPACFQGRINGCKGIWTVSAPYDCMDARHRDIWIQIRESQRKVIPQASDLDDTTCHQDRWTFEIVKYSKPPSASNLYMDFMPILVDRHVSRETICSLVSSQLDWDFDKLYVALDDSAQLRRWMQQWKSSEETTTPDVEHAHAFPRTSCEQVILLLESGFCPKTCMYLATCLQYFFEWWTHQLRMKLKIRLPKSTSVYGIADPTGCLKPGEVFLGFTETFRDENTEEAWSYLDGEVLVARHPSLRQSDIQKVKAVYKTELRHLRDVIVFPIHGARPLADKLQGGDYDGDTFWVCWDTRIAKYFMNAPAPSPPTTSVQLEKLSIRVDKRKLKEVLGPSGNIEEWLSCSFDFRLQKDYLGEVTNLHKRLAYKENNISAPNVTALAGLHDAIIDSEKNGYTFDAKAFAAFKKKRNMKDPGKPAYEQQLSTPEKERDTRRGAVKYNPDHIIDKVFFEVVDPKIKEIKARLREALASADHNDDDLARLYLDFKQCAEYDEILKNLMRDLDEVVSKWNATMNRTQLEDDKTKEATDRGRSRCLEMYRNIQPRGTNHSLNKEMSRARLPHEPTTWDLLKASTFYYDRHMKSTYGQSQRSAWLLFAVAGPELCYMKAMSQGNERPGVIAQNIFAIMKPKKERSAREVMMASLSAQNEVEEGGAAREELMTVPEEDA